MLKFTAHNTAGKNEWDTGSCFFLLPQESN